jgi:hypothetical protein
MGVSYSIVCPIYLVARPTLASNSARLVLASMCATGLAARQYHDHPLYTSTAMGALV